MGEWERLFARLVFDERGLVPAIIQDEDGAVLTLCYLNREAIARSLATGRVHVFRRSKGRLMLKGETSGHIQEVREVRVDCEGKSLLLRVKQHVAGCHKGYRSCYFERYVPERDAFEVADARVFDPGKVYGG